MNGHTVETVRTDDHVRVEVNGQVIAETRSPVLLRESNLPDRYYIPPQDIRFELFEPTDLRTTCPFKGEASYWSLKDGAGRPNLAWAYPDPIPNAAEIKDHLSFYTEAVDFTVNGQKR